MQIPPLILSDVSLLLAVGALILLLISGLSSSSYGQTNIMVNKKRLRNAGVALGIMFLITVGIRIVGVVGPVLG